MFNFVTDISANAMLYAFYQLALHFEVQEELYKEIQTICGDHLPHFTDIPNMIYTLCVMYETMRLYPIVGTIPNRPQKDQVLLGKYIIPRNTSIGPDFVSLHRNEKYWGSTCDEFNPSRFDNRNPTTNTDWHSIMDGKIKIPVRGALLSFGDGARACLGSPS